jgi:hypothetical protein
MKPLDDNERRLAAVTADVIATTIEDVSLPDAARGLASKHAIQLLARSFIELRDQIRALHDLVDQTDPHDPIGVGLTKVGLERRPSDHHAQAEPRLVRSPAQVKAMSSDDLLALYCQVMREVAEVFVKYETYVVRAWDGMDGCWTDCTGEVGRDEALHYWTDRTDGGTRQVDYAEIDYCRIFPGGTRMHWDGAEGREMHR